MEDALLPIAAAEVEAGKRSGQPALIFFTVKSEASLPTQVRNVCGFKNVSEAPQARHVCLLPQRSISYVLQHMISPEAKYGLFLLSQRGALLLTADKHLHHHGRF